MGLILADLRGHFLEAGAEPVLRDVLECVRRLDLEHVQHLCDKVFRLERQRCRAFRARTHDITRPAVRRFHRLFRALAGVQLHTVLAAHGDRADEGIDLFQWSK